MFYGNSFTNNGDIYDNEEYNIVSFNENFGKYDTDYWVNRYDDTIEITIWKRYIQPFKGNVMITVDILWYS